MKSSSRKHRSKYLISSQANFLYEPPIANATALNIDKLKFIEIQNVNASKDTINKVL